MIRIVSLAENTAEKPGLLGEHGLAIWIETGDKRVLFDTGQGLVLLHNAKELGVPIECTDAIVLSHGHYDHTGGLAAVLDGATKPALYAHPDAFLPKYACGPSGPARYIGIPDADKEAAMLKTSRIVETTRPMEVAPGLFVTGPVPRETEHEQTSGPFFLDCDCRQADSMTDDQALYFETQTGTVVLLGCAHAGVVNTLAYVRNLTDKNPIRAVIGGMHLVNASRERLDQTVAAFKQMGVRSLRPAHCTGAPAIAWMRHAFPDRCQTWSVGTQAAFPE